MTHKTDMTDKTDRADKTNRSKYWMWDVKYKMR